MAATILQALGGEAGCRKLSAQFYGRVAQDPVLKRLFPGKSLRCATDEFAAFLIQFLGGDEEQTQDRWWLSIGESHARFRISAVERSAWLRNMTETLEAASIEETTREALRNLFLHSSAYVIGKDSAHPQHPELADRWTDQLALDKIIAAIVGGRDQDAIIESSRFLPRRSVYAGLLARMVESGRAALIKHVVNELDRELSLAPHRFAGRTLLHVASAAGCSEVAETLLRLGMNPDTEDRGSHTPLYAVANGCASDAGPALVHLLVNAGADVNASGGVMQATPLHMAARRGHTAIAKALLQCGANIDARDINGVTPLQRALNCRRQATAELLVAHRLSSGR